MNKNQIVIVKVTDGIQMCIPEEAAQSIAEGLRDPHSHNPTLANAIEKVLETGQLQTVKRNPPLP